MKNDETKPKTQDEPSRYPGPQFWRDDQSEAVNIPNSSSLLF